MAGTVGGIGSLPSLALPVKPLGSPAATGAEPASFQELLLRSVEQVEGMQASAQGSIESSLIGEDVTLVETLSSVKKADLALRMMMQVRNKIMDAYEEIKQLRM